MAKQQIIEVEAESLEEAREQVKSQIPKGLHFLSEKIVSDGKPKTVKAIADTTEGAYMKAQGDIPANASVLEKKDIATPEQKVITVEAIDEHIAREQVASQIGNTAIVKAIRLTTAGKRGFLGIGNKPNQYEADVFQQAVVEITYRTKAKISAEIGKKRASKICASCGKTISAKEMEKDILVDIWGISLGENAKYMPNVMQGLAMKCNRCGVWICSRCAENTALSAGAGMILHSNCGGMFETPK